MDPSRELLATLLLAAPLAAAMLVWLPKLLPGRAGDRFQDYLTTGTSLVSLALVLALAGAPGEELTFSIGYLRLYLDSLSMFFLLLVSLVALVASCYAGPCWRRRSGTEALDRTLFYALFNLFHFTMVLVPMVSNLVVLWIGIELTTVTSTALVAAERTREHFEAAWKYIIITSTGIIFALLGTLFLASAVSSGGASPSLELPQLLDQLKTLDMLGRNDNLVHLSFLFILVGYGTKAGIAPMHTWLPDAHGQAPYPVSALLSGVLLKCALYAVLRFATMTNTALGDDAFTSHLLLAVGLLSLVAAIPFVLKRNAFKRILAYHSLEHMGIILVGIGIGGPVALFGALLHVLNHGVTKSLMFLAYGNVQDNFTGQPREGVLRAMPWTGTCLALGGLALVGSPPFSIFLSEFLILWGAVGRAVAEPAPWLIAPIVVFLVSVALIFGGLVRHLSQLLLGDPPEDHRRETPRQVVPLLGLLAVVVVLGVTIPDSGPLDLRGLIEESVRIVSGTGDGP